MSDSAARVSAKDARAADVLAMIEAAKSEDIPIRDAGVFALGLWTARTVKVLRCQSPACMRQFLLLDTHPDATTLYCSKTCVGREKQRRRRDRDSGRVRLPVPPPAELTDAERERLTRCPFPDKVGWHTREGADAMITLMRAANRPRSKNLHAYLCDGPGDQGCGFYHVGDRTKFAGDPVVARYGSAYHDREEA